LQNISDIDIAEFLTADFLPPHFTEQADDTFKSIAEKGSAKKMVGRDDLEVTQDLPKYITNYIGSKQKLADWIWANTPEDVSSVFDAFGGSNVVGYMYKRKGLKVYTNDLLKYSYHISRAIIENNSVKLSDEEIEKLTQPKSNAGDFIARNFRNTFFTNEVVNILDGLRASIDSLKGYKKDIALFALGKTCISGKGGFGHFSSTTMHGKRRFTKNQFLQLYKSNLKRVSDLVFDNGKENKAYNGDILEVAPKVKADLAYFDPPYATHFSTTNYETAYHFVEGLITKWRGREIKEDSKTKTFEIRSKTITQKTAGEFFENYLTASKHIKYWIISYRDNAYPSERQLKSIIDSAKKDSRMKSRDHHYSISSRHSENSDAKEHIFICGPRGFLKSKSDILEDSDSLLLHTKAIWEEMQNEIRYRVRDPKDFIKESFRHRKLEGVDGISIIIARLKPDKVPEDHNPDSMVIQAYRFVKKSAENPDGWTMDKARMWIDEHEGKKAELTAPLEYASSRYGHSSLQDKHSTGQAGNAEVTEEFENIQIEEDFLFALATRRSGFENKQTKDKTRVSGYMGSKYFVLDWIWRAVPKDLRDNPEGKVFFDAFSGGANVAYFFKQKGFKVITNDILDYPTHIAKAVIENSSVTLSDEDVESLLKENTSAGDFAFKNFHGYYYTKPVLMWLDNSWANIQKLKGYKKDLALSALGATVKAKAMFGDFSRSKRGLHTSYKELTQKDDRIRRSSIGNLTVKQFERTFKNFVRKFNSLVFDNGQENKVYSQDTWKLIPKVKANLAYFDPPYVTEFQNNDYEFAIHFVEGLMTMWKGKKLKDNAWHSYESSTKYTKKDYPDLFKKMIDGSRKQCEHILISYRNKATPTKSEIAAIIRDNYQKYSVKEIEVEYSLGVKDSKAGGRYARELLFLGSKPIKAKAKAKAEETSLQERVSRNCRTTLTCDAHLKSEGKEGDPQFTFILARVGTNANGDHFTKEELVKNHATIVNRKIDLKHSQDLMDIVGGVIKSEFIESEGHVRCVGELYTDVSDKARAAQRMMQKEIIKQVSMECDYEEGECSICGKRVKTRTDDCIHLKKYKGREYRGKKVYEILHNITFTGIGLLDKAGADENARILTVATQPITMMAGYAEINNTEDSHMSENKDPEKGGKEKQAETDIQTSDLKAKLQEESEKLKSLKVQADEKDDRIKELETELEKASKELEKAQKKIEALEREKQAAKQKAKAESLLKKWERIGRSFESDEERKKELGRLISMSEEALGAIEETVTSFGTMKEKFGDSNDENNEPDRKKQTKAVRRANALNKPESVDDVDVTLKDKLKSGFMAAYESRIGG